MMKNATNGTTKASDKLFNFRPALFAAFFLIFGVVFAYYRFLRGVSLWWLFAFLPVVVCVLAFSRGIEGVLKRLAALGVLAVFFGLGFVGFRAELYDFRNLPQYSGEVTVVGTVERKVETKIGYRLILTDLSIDEEGVEGKLNVYLPRPLWEKVAVADRVAAVGDIHTSLEFFDGYGFRDSQVDNKQVYSLRVEDTCHKVGRSSNVFLLIRARMEEVIYRGMDETPSGLTLALLTGDTSGLDEDLSANMRYGGISHIFAVSGLNVGALYAFCLLIFTKTPLRKAPKAARFCSLVGILFLYSGVCSFTPSVVRAAVLCAVGYFVRLLESNADMLNGLGVCAIFILLLKPMQLFNVGFQLSFLACVGLVLLTKPIGQVFDECRKAFRKRFPRKLRVDEKAAVLAGDTLPPSVGERVWRGCVGVLSASIAAQITTLPVLFLQFGYVSGWSLLLNFIFVPIIDGIFTILLLLVLVCCLLPTLVSTVVLYLPSVAWSAIMLLFEVADFSSFSLEGVQLSLGICVCYYGGVLFLSDKFNISKEMRRWLAVVCFAASLTGILLKGAL